MTPQRWSDVERVYHSALACDPADLTEFLNRACAADQDLRREVESLLAANRGAGNFLNPNDLATQLRQIAAGHAQIQPGTTIGPYRVASKIGAGGMGEVYLADDPTLDRKVALKILHGRYAGDSSRRGRLGREARAASALNHPNIITVYQFGDAGDLQYIVTEFVSGETLRQRLSRGRLDTAEILDIGLQTAAALEAAHSAGIIHRDIKPENIMIRPDGLVKVLDFGLAGIPRANTETGAHVAQADALATGSGLLGTPHYMSPEQARGEAVDARSDIFSLGAVLYEMATGQAPFRGTTPALVFDGILNRRPDPITAPNLPRELETLIGRTLEKDRGLRIQTVADLRAALLQIQQNRALSGTAPGKPRKTIRWALAGLLLVEALAGLWVARTPYPHRAPTFRQLTTNSGELSIYNSTISPDGKHIGWSEPSGLKVQNIDTGESRLISDTAGAIFHRWHPDSSRLIATLPTGKTRTLLGIPIGGAATRETLKYELISPSGSRVLSGKGPWTIQDPDGGKARVIDVPEKDAAYTVPLWSWDGRRILFIKRAPDLIKRALRAPNTLSTLYTIDAATGVMTPAFTSAKDKFLYYATWLPGGRILYVERPNSGNQSSLWMLRIDSRTGKRVGEPELIIPYSEAGIFSVSASRDGKRVTFLKGQGQVDVYVADLEGRNPISTPRRLTFDTGDDIPSAWSADSREVIFESNRRGVFDIYRQRTDDSNAVSVAAGPGNKAEALFSPGGRWMLYAESLPGPAKNSRAQRLMRIPGGGGMAQEILISEHYEGHECSSRNCVLVESEPQAGVVYALDPETGRGREWFRSPQLRDTFALSPDGLRLAYIPDDLKTIRIQPLNGGPARELHPSVSAPINDLKWSADGQSLFVCTNSPNESRVYLVDVTGAATMLWRQGGAGPARVIPSPDGKRLAIQSTLLENNVWLMENFE